MLVRVVKMTFRAEAVETFRQLFESRRQQIREFDGCTHLELWQDRLHANIFFTYSHWQHAEALQTYRTSPFFAETWQQTKLLFAARAEAWSVNQLTVIP